MKLDIQRFSGGSYDYTYAMLEKYYTDKMYDIELDDMINDLVILLHDLEWWQSGDYSEEEYRKTVREFKQKWFSGNRDERLKSYIDKEISELNKKLLDLTENAK